MTNEGSTGAQPDDGAVFTIDLSGDGPETPVATFGRIVSGILILLVAVAILIGCGYLLFASPFIPSLWEWAEIIGDFAIFIGAIALGLAIVGFELIRRGRKANHVDYAALLSAIPGVDVDPPVTLNTVQSDGTPPPNELPKCSTTIL